jgi:PAS domain S-box-containing protein
LGAWEFDCVDGTTERTLRHDQIFGYKIVQPEWGMRIFESLVVPEDLEMVKKGFREVGAAGKINIECRIIWPDRSIHWIFIAGKEFRNGKGEPVRLYGTVRDITDRKKAEAELGEIARIKSEFMAMASHEIRSPLAVIKIALHLLGKNLQKARKGEYDAIGIATRNIDRLARLVDEILGIEALDSGKMQCVMKPEDINALIREVMAGFGPLAQMKGIVLDFDPAEGLPKIPLDRDKVVQVMTNLISNALKFINTGHIKVRTMRHNGFVRIDTEDTGPGIKVDDIGKLFKSFSRISHEGQRQEQGTGLGLSISKKIVSAHGGEIGVESVFGKGATFFITLPLEQATPPIPGD